MKTLVQVSNQWFRQDDERSRYYDLVYARREGFYRPEHFWEVPLWAARMAKILGRGNCEFSVYAPNLKCHVSRECFASVMEANREKIEKLVRVTRPYVDWHLGGYVKPNPLPGTPWHESLQDYCTWAGVPYREGCDYSLWAGTRCIPRLTLSTGCKHRCSFCTVEKKVKERSWDEIEDEVMSFQPLDFKLVYLNDKTFGQASNWSMIGAAKQKIEDYNPDFQGFIVQTTANQVCRQDMLLWAALKVKYVEIGVESWNEHILKDMRKPASETSLGLAFRRLEYAGIRVIPNILVGYPMETKATYTHTLHALDSYRRNISHLNIYTTSVYDGTNLADRLHGGSSMDHNENTLERSWYTDLEVHQWFERELLRFARSLL